MWYLYIVGIIAAFIGGYGMARGRQRKEEETLQQTLVAELAGIKRILHLILQRLTPARSAAIHFDDEEGELLMPATIQIGGKGAVAVFTEFSGPGGTGTVVPPSGPITFASDNTLVATVDANGNVTAVAPGTANISGLDPASPNQVTASDVITVVPASAPVAQSATLVLSAN